MPLPPPAGPDCACRTVPGIGIAEPAFFGLARPVRPLLRQERSQTFFLSALVEWTPHGQRSVVPGVLPVRGLGSRHARRPRCKQTAPGGSGPGGIRVAPCGYRPVCDLPSRCKSAPAPRPKSRRTLASGDRGRPLPPRAKDAGPKRLPPRRRATGPRKLGRETVLHLLSGISGRSGTNAVTFSAPTAPPFAPRRTIRVGVAV